jgi:hypothetical protein
MIKHEYVGSSFDSFLEKNTFEECKEEAVKRVLIWQLEMKAKEQHCKYQIDEKL